MVRVFLKNIFVPQFSLRDTELLQGLGLKVWAAANPSGTNVAFPGAASCDQLFIFLPKAVALEQQDWEVWGGSSSRNQLCWGGSGAFGAHCWNCFSPGHIRKGLHPGKGALPTSRCGAFFPEGREDV